MYQKQKKDSKIVLVKKLGEHFIDLIINYDNKQLNSMKIKATKKHFSFIKKQNNKTIGEILQF